MNDWLGSVGKFLDWDWTFEHWEKWFFVLCMLMHSCMLSHFSRVWLFVILWTVALQVPLSMGFSRQEYWSGLPCSPPRDLPNPEIKPVSLTSPALAGGFFTTSAIWKAPCMLMVLPDFWLAFILPLAHPWLELRLKESSSQIFDSSERKEPVCNPGHLLRKGVSLW